jgi:hypothetical protein
MNVVQHGREKAVRFGSSASLVGVMTEARAGTADAERPAVLFLNSGILHRVGSCRIHVQLARALSAVGFHSLRFDYSGIGDSDQRRDSLSFEESAVVETREAMDYLAKTKGVKKFILMGLCSGADMAHETAVADARVAGLIMLDAWAYKTFAFQVRHYGPKLFEWGRWKNSIGIRWRKLRGTYVSHLTALPKGDGVEYEVPKYVRVFPPRERVAKDLRAFVERGIAMHYIWTGGLIEYNHKGQHRGTFRDVRFGDLLVEDHVCDADHILTGLRHQQYVVSQVVEWATRTYGGGMVAPAPAVEAPAVAAPPRATVRSA